MGREDPLYAGQTIDPALQARYEQLLQQHSFEVVRQQIADDYVRDTVLPVLHTVLPLLLGD
jgi:hypothetical protein